MPIEWLKGGDYATAFSPTDAMPLTRPAKALMAAESTLSVVTVLLVAARARLRQPQIRVAQLGDRALGVGLPFGAAEERLTERCAVDDDRGPGRSRSRDRALDHFLQHGAHARRTVA